MIGNFFYLPPAVLVVHLMREITGKHEGLITQFLNRVMYGRFRSLTSDEESTFLDVPLDIITNLFPGLELDELTPWVIGDMSLPSAVKPLDAGL